MAKITAARKAAIAKNKGTLARAAKSLAPKNVNKFVLKKDLTPGTVLILVAGLHKGKRVVFLKQLASGLLLVTGPYKVNGVPVRRVNKAYAITTSTKVALPEAVTKAVESVDDKFFADLKAENVKFVAAAQKEATKNNTTASKVAPVSSKRVELQKKVDAALLPAVQAVGKEFVSYLGSRFHLTKGQYPHNLKF
jgi:large subunit ribosomal protein L6e